MACSSLVVAEVVVCDPRKIDRHGNKSDRIDARELADLLRCGRLSAVYHQDCGLRALQELARTYLVLTKDQTRVMNRIKALYPSWAIPCAGQSCYGPRQRQAWLSRSPHPAVRLRAETYYQQMDSLQALRQPARQQLLREGRKHPAFRRLRQIPYIGPTASCRDLPTLRVFRAGQKRRDIRRALKALEGEVLHGAGGGGSGHWQVS